MSFNLRLEGAAELDRKLAQLEPKVAKKHLRRSLRAGAKIILTEVKARVPVLTGAIKRSLAVRTGKAKRGRREVSMHVVTDTRKVPELITSGKHGQRYFYPAVVEYGSRHRAAEPFMRPAFDSRKHAAVNAIMRSLRNAVEQEAKK